MGNTGTLETAATMAATASVNFAKMKFSARLCRATWLMACVIITVAGTLRLERFKFHYRSIATCLAVRLGNSLLAVLAWFSVSLCLPPQVGGVWQYLMSAINYKEQQKRLDRRQSMFNDFVRFINFTHRIDTHQTHTDNRFPLLTLSFCSSGKRPLSGGSRTTACN